MGAPRKAGMLPPARKFSEIESESNAVMHIPGQAFDGFRIDLARAVSRSFQLTHSLVFGSTQEPPHYSIMAFFANGTSRYQAKIVPSWGAVTAVAMGVVSRWTYTFTVSSGRNQVLITELGYKGDDSTAGVRFGNGELTMSFVQSVRRWLMIGVEAMMNMSGTTYFTTSMRAAFRATERTPFQQIWNFTISTLGIARLAYSQRKAKGHKNWVAALEMSQNQQGKFGSRWVLGYCYQLTSSFVRAVVTSDYELIACVDENMGNDLTVSLSADMNYAQDQYSVGLGLSSNF